MARIRTLKPDFTSDAKVARLSRDARLTFLLLFTEADDFGRLVATPKRLIGALYPHDEDVTPAKLNKWLGELDREGMIIRYRSDDVEYLWVKNFVRHQKISHATESRLPDPPDKSESGFVREPLRKRSRKPRERLRPDLGSGREVERERDSSSSSVSAEPRSGKSREEEEFRSAVVNLLADRHVARRTSDQPIVDPPKFRTSVIAGIERDSGTAIFAAIHDHPEFTIEGIAELVEPTTNGKPLDATAAAARALAEKDRSCPDCGGSRWREVDGEAVPCDHEVTV